MNSGWVAFWIAFGVIGLGATGACGNACVNGCDRGYSEGDRAGTVVKFSYKGVMYKSWEGTMNLGGMTADGHGGLSPNVWDFTVRDPTLVPVIQAAQQAGQSMTVHYIQWWASPIQMESDYELVSVKVTR